MPTAHLAARPSARLESHCSLCREQESKANADSLADLKAASARELTEARRQAQEQQQQSGSEAQVKLAAAHSAREKLQVQVDQLQSGNGQLHQQLADAHGKVLLFCVQSAISDVPSLHVGKGYRYWCLQHSL